MPAILGSGKRKYHDIMNQLLTDPKAQCATKCSRIDTTTIINGVKKEKVIWTKKGKVPKTKRLDVEVTEVGVIFKLVEDTSINNL